jgi:hypothetical protein
MIGQIRQRDIFLSQDPMELWSAHVKQEVYKVRVPMTPRDFQ